MSLFFAHIFHCGFWGIKLNRAVWITGFICIVKACIGPGILFRFRADRMPAAGLINFYSEAKRVLNHIPKSKGEYLCC